MSNERDTTAANADATLTALPIINREASPALDDRDVNEILERKFGGDKFRLVDWKLEPFEGASGFLGQYYRLRITAIVAGKTDNLQFFAKAPPPSDSPQFKFLQRCDTFNKEIGVYTDLARRMGTGGEPKWIVECYLCKRNIIIVLEDASIDGYATLDKYTRFDWAHCVWLSRTLSRLHSRSLILDERLRREGDKRTVFDLYGHLLNEVLFVKGDDRSERALAASITGLGAAIDLVEELDGGGRAVVRRRLAEWARKISRLLAPSGVHRNTICHRDAWANNLMFRHDRSGDPNGCYIIDFQFLRYCPPAIDFACCLYLTTDRATRDRHFDSLARIYHDSLADGLAEEGLDAEDCLSWTAFQRSCAEARHTALVYAALNLQVMLMSSEATETYLYGAVEEIERTLYGDRRAELVRHQCQNVPEYRERLSEIIIEIRDRLPERPSDP